MPAPRTGRARRRDAGVPNHAGLAAAAASVRPRFASRGEGRPQDGVKTTMYYKHCLQHGLEPRLARLVVTIAPLGRVQRERELARAPPRALAHAQHRERRRTATPAPPRRARRPVLLVPVPGPSWRAANTSAPSAASACAARPARCPTRRAAGQRADHPAHRASARVVVVPRGELRVTRGEERFLKHGGASAMRFASAAAASSRPRAAPQRVRGQRGGVPGLRLAGAMPSASAALGQGRRLATRASAAAPPPPRPRPRPCP